jgi:hypothetical protein
VRTSDATGIERIFDQDKVQRSQVLLHRISQAICQAKPVV